MKDPAGCIRRLVNGAVVSRLVFFVFVLGWVASIFDLFNIFVGIISF